VVKGHSSLPAMSPFDRTHTTSYSSLIEIIRLSCNVYEIQPSIGPKSLQTTDKQTTDGIAIAKTRT